MNRGIEICLLLSLPAAVALFIIPEQIVIVLFERGAFSRSDALSTAAALQAYAIGVPAFVLNKVMLPGFFARKDTKTPMYFAIASMVLFVVMAYAVIGPYGFTGVALATSVASWFNVALLALGLRFKDFWRVDARLISRSIRILISALFMGVVLWVLSGLTATWFDDGLLLKLSGLVVLVIGGGVVFGACALLLKAAKPSDLRALKRS